MVKEFMNFKGEETKGPIHITTKEEINGNQKQKIYLESDLDQDLKSLEFFVDELQRSKDILELEINRNHFSQQEIEEFKQEIDYDEKFITEIKKSINKSNLDIKMIENKINELNKLEERFRKVLSDIKPERLS